MKVTECNATRVGGREPRPNSVQLIADGCSLMPQVISDMRPGPLGLEASLTAFRIDGSDQIDIACNVLICRKNCEKRVIHFIYPIPKLNLSFTRIHAIKLSKDIGEQRH